jgi:ArsR family transcriptional regulator, arsenate/arsenite/antimonite-responsive transcriptional repressor
VSQLVSFAKALGDATRWRIVRMVMDEPLCVCELADILEMPQSSVSSHVQIIRKAGLLESEKREKWTYFRVQSKYRKVIRAMEGLFDEGDLSSSQTDLSRMAARLEQREGSCCPGPQFLKSRRNLPTSSVKS